MGHHSNHSSKIYHEWITGIGPMLNKLDTVMRPLRKFRKHSHPHVIVSHSVIKVWGGNAQIRSKDSLFVDSIQSWPGGRGGKGRRGGRSHSECPKGVILQSWLPPSKPFTYSGWSFYPVNITHCRNRFIHFSVVKQKSFLTHRMAPNISRISKYSQYFKSGIINIKFESSEFIAISTIL